MALCVSPANGLSLDDFQGKNYIIVVFDQMRQVMDFPANWSQTYLPGLTRLQNNGLSFTQATCSSAMCSPSRASLLTGFLPAQHGVRYTLEDDMPSSLYPQVVLPYPDQITNLAQLAQSVGYDAVYKGKFHLMKTAGPNDTSLPSQMLPYGFTRWNPPVSTWG